MKRVFRIINVCIPNAFCLFMDTGQHTQPMMLSLCPTHPNSPEVCAEANGNQCVVIEQSTSKWDLMDEEEKPED